MEYKQQQRIHSYTIIFLYFHSLIHIKQPQAVCYEHTHSHTHSERFTGMFLEAGGNQRTQRKLRWKQGEHQASNPSVNQKPWSCMEETAKA